jgi:hypothetical protein
MEKTISILEGLLETHFCRRNYMHVPMCGPEERDEDGELIWKPCDCETCAVLKKAVKSLKKKLQISGSISG